MALEEASISQKAWMVAAILILNIMLASFINEFWFYIVFMGSLTCPFLAFVLPAEIYTTIMVK